MFRRKLTDEHLERISRWDLQGLTLREMASRLSVTKETVRKHLKKIRDERRRYRNIEASHFLDELDTLKRKMWAAARTNEVSIVVGKGGTRTTTKGPPIAAARMVLDILKEQARLLGLGSIKVDVASEASEATKVVNVVVKNRGELDRAMSLGVFESRMMPGQSPNVE